VFPGCLFLAKPIFGFVCSRRIGLSQSFTPVAAGFVVCKVLCAALFAEVFPFLDSFLFFLLSCPALFGQVWRRWAAAGHKGDCDEVFHIDY